MAKLGRWARCVALALSLCLPAIMGCQTSINGMTLPSGYYLRDTPDYIPRGPDFPLNNELNQQRRAYNNAFGPDVRIGPGGFQQP